MPVPDGVARTAAGLYGERGAAWAQRLPALIATLGERWGLRVLSPYGGLAASYVAPVVCADGTEAVLKVGVPSPELLTEIEALRLYAGRGAARLLQADEAEGALLVERLQPGTPLADLADDVQATAIAVDVMRGLWRPLPAPHPFPSVADWARGLERLRARFDGGTGPFPAALVERAESLFAGLIASSAPPVLLHGDLHHWNIVRARREPWLAIDPKGLAGEPAYEAGALVRNRLPEPAAPGQTRRLLERRIAQFAEALGCERERLLGWSLAQAVLSAWWSYEDSGRIWGQALRVAECLSGLARRGRRGCLRARRRREHPDQKRGRHHPRP
ncbi:MAG: aminoglycoside phosphotransferase family protein [Anaerolineae bacterium]|nr:aminoglycoside phosphotransferase family protein [Anaerolineae bacterium]